MTQREAKKIGGRNVQPRRFMVTGAASTARVICEHLQKLGHRIAACDADPKVVDAMRVDNPNMHVEVADLSSEDATLRFAEASIEFLGGVDFLINVVGVAGPIALTEEISFEAWKKTFDVNLHASFLLCQSVLPLMKAQRFGGIVNFSTSSTATRLPHRSAYVASKFALEGLTLNIAREAGPYGIRANVIRPGGINNDRLRMVINAVADREGTDPKEVYDRAKRYVSTRQFIEPSELAETIAFLCSDAAKNITGQLISVDGNQEWEA